MARTRASARTRGKSDPIDALAVARAVLREPDLPVASHDEVSRGLKLLVDRHEDLVAYRTATINRLLWRVHELDPSRAARPRRGCYEGPLRRVCGWSNPRPPNSSAFYGGIALRVAHSKVGHLDAEP